MIDVNLPRPLVRLLIDRSLLPQLQAMSRERYEVFREAVRFAEDAIASRPTAEDELPRFIVAFETLELVVAFSRLRERFTVRAIIELGDDTPPPGEVAPRAGETAAESLLRAVGVEARPPGELRSLLGLGGLDGSPWLGLALPAKPAIRFTSGSVGFAAALAVTRLGLSGPFVTLAASGAAKPCEAPPSVPAEPAVPSSRATAAVDAEPSQMTSPGAATPRTSTDP